jgi:hypothetical protein
MTGCSRNLIVFHRFDRRQGSASELRSCARGVKDVVLRAMFLVRAIGILRCRRRGEARFVGSWGGLRQSNGSPQASAKDGVDGVVPPRQP